VIALALLAGPLVDGTQAIPENDYVCPDLPGDGEGSSGGGPRWNAELPPDVTRWKWLVSDAFNATCAPWVVDDALHVIACESVGDPDAYNGITGVSGLFQMHPIWHGQLGDLGFHGVSVFDPHANAALAAHIWRTQDGWGAWACDP
jgi:hypothetical protein